MRRGSLSIVIAILGASCLSAQRYSFKFYGEEEGLQNMRVRAVLQDRGGFLWVGTQHGLYRYDGSRFVSFWKTEGLPDTRIESIYESHDATLWIGTQSGLARRTGERFETIPLKLASGITGRQGIVSDHSGRLFVTTERGLLTGINTPLGFEFTRVPAPGGILENQVSSVYAQASGTIVYGCGNSLCQAENQGVS